MMRIMSEALYVKRQYLDLKGSEDVTTALSVLRMMYVVLKRSEYVMTTLSVMRQTYLDLRRSEDVMTVLSVLRWTYFDLGRSEGILMALLIQQWTGTMLPDRLLYEAAYTSHCLTPTVYLSSPVNLDPFTMLSWTTWK